MSSRKTSFCNGNRVDIEESLKHDDIKTYASLFAKPSRATIKFTQKLLKSLRLLIRTNNLFFLTAKFNF